MDTKIDAIETEVAATNGTETQLRDLSDFQLALIGGGIGDVIVA